MMELFLGGIVFGILVGYAWESLTYDEEAERKRLVEQAMRRYREATQKKR